MQLLTSPSHRLSPILPPTPVRLPGWNFLPPDDGRTTPDILCNHRPWIDSEDLHQWKCTLHSRIVPMQHISRTGRPFREQNRSGSECDHGCCCCSAEMCAKPPAPDVCSRTIQWDGHWYLWIHHIGNSGITTPPPFSDIHIFKKWQFTRVRLTFLQMNMVFIRIFYILPFYLTNSDRISPCNELGVSSLFDYGSHAFPAYHSPNCRTGMDGNCLQFQSFPWSSLSGYRIINNFPPETPT